MIKTHKTKVPAEIAVHSLVGTLGKRFGGDENYVFQESK